MRLDKLNDKQRILVENMLLRGRGEIVPVESTIVIRDEGQEPRVEPVRWEFAIGKMTPDQSGKLVMLLATLAAKGVDIKKTFGETSNLAFLYALDEESTNFLLSIITRESVEWIAEHWDFEGWGMDVLGAFLRHNHFLSLIQKAVALLPSLGVSQTGLTDLLRGTQSITALSNTSG